MMSNDYLMIITKRDERRFSNFNTGYDRDVIKSIAIFEDAENIWALGPSTSDNLWSSIKKGDRIFFAKKGMPFSHCGIVKDKKIDQQHAIEIWGDSPRMREHKRLVLFSKVHEVDLPFNQLCRKGGVVLINSSTNIYASNKMIEFTSENPESITGTVIYSHNGAPDKKSEVMTRYIRNTTKVKKLKTMYDDKCQVCNYVICTSNTQYSEVHHIYPLQDGGDDDFENMIVLCPTHHVEFDYKVIGIHVDMKTIIDLYGNTIGQITLDKNHQLNKKNIQFHLKGMKKK